MQALKLLLAAAVMAGGAAQPVPSSQAVNGASRHPATVSEVATPGVEVEVEFELESAPRTPVAPDDDDVEGEPAGIPPELRQPDGTDWSDGVHVDPDLGLASDVGGSGWGRL